MLFSRRFMPYFFTQSLGALNDNVFKNVLLLMVSYSQVNTLPMAVDLFVNLAAGLFILPFLLFSAHAGQLADNVDKALLIRRLKMFELCIMLVAMWAILTHSYLVMLLLLFLMGVQSAYFGPVKYSLLPRILHEHELVSGNAWVEVGTFLAILMGTLSAGIIVASDMSTYWAAAMVFVLALLGVIASRLIPDVPCLTPVTSPFSIIKATRATIARGRKNWDIWMAILAISWFWFLGATYLTQIPNFSRVTLNADPTVVSLLLLLFSMGIGIGSFACERLSHQQVELGIAALGLLVLGLFGIDLYSALPSAPVTAPMWDVVHFIADTRHYRLMFDLFMIGVGGGLFIVPLYTFIQVRAKEEECAQAIACNNIFNALFMVASAIIAMLLLVGLQWPIERLFLVLAYSSLLVLLTLLLTWSELLIATFSYGVCRIFNRCVIVNTAELDKIKEDKETSILIEVERLNLLTLLVVNSLFSRPVYVATQPQSATGLTKYLIACRQRSDVTAPAAVLMCCQGDEIPTAVEPVTTLKCRVTRQSKGYLLGRVETVISR